MYGSQTLGAAVTAVLVMLVVVLIALNLLLFMCYCHARGRSWASLICCCTHEAHTSTALDTQSSSHGSHVMEKVESKVDEEPVDSAM